MRWTFSALIAVSLIVAPASVTATAQIDQYQVLDGAHPDWRDVVKTQAYANWAATQPDWIKRIIIQNGENLVDGEGAAEVLTRFKRDTSNSVATQVAPTSTATAMVPECKGSVEKGLAAWNRGDAATALCHWLPKAKKGDATAQNNMALLWENGSTPQTPTNHEEAARWYTLAANQGLVTAMNNLAPFSSVPVIVTRRSGGLLSPLDGVMEVPRPSWHPWASPLRRPTWRWLANSSRP